MDAAELRGPVSDLLEEHGFDEVAKFCRETADRFDSRDIYGVCVKEARFADTVERHGGVKSAILAEVRAMGMMPFGAFLVSRYQGDGILIRAIPGDDGAIVYEAGFEWGREVYIRLGGMVMRGRYAGEPA